MADTFPLPASMPLPSDSFWSRLCHTSLFDALRGKVEGHLDARRVIASFQLGEMLSSVVWDVVQRTRLWRSEKVDVARELASHFREGLDSGRSAEELLADFGERPMVIKLIRRAKLRSRAWAYHVWFWISRGALLVALVLTLTFAAIALEFYFRKPTIKLNVIADATVQIEKVAEEDRAWPIYRQAIITLQQSKEHHLAIKAIYIRQEMDDLPSEMESLLTQHANTIAQIRIASQKRLLGYRLADASDAEWNTLPAFGGNTKPEWNETAAIRGEVPARDFVLPVLHDIRRLHMLLYRDAQFALKLEDGQRFTDDILAELRMLRQLLDAEPVGVRNQTYVHEDAQYTFALVLDTLQHKPHVLSDTQLTLLKQACSSWNELPAYPSLELVKQDLEDFLQRYYTDNGRGNGRITADGMKAIHLFERRNGFPVKDALVKDPDLGFLPNCIQALFIESRDEVRAIGEAYLQIDRQMWQKPHGQNLKAIRIEHAAIHRTLNSLPYKPLKMFFEGHPIKYGEYPSYDRTKCQFATLLIALEQYYRQVGHWPANLEALSPQFLDSVPSSNSSEPALHYEITDDGKATLNSSELPWQWQSLR